MTPQASIYGKANSRPQDNSRRRSRQFMQRRRHALIRKSRRFLRIPPHPPRSRFGTFPTQGGRLIPPFVLFASSSSASWHLPHQGEGICRRDGHCPSAKNRCGRLFMSAGLFMRRRRNSRRLCRQFMHRRCHALIRKSCRFLRITSSASRHLPHQGEGICRRDVLFAYPSSASWHLPNQEEGICSRDGHCPSAKMRRGRLFMSTGLFMTPQAQFIPICHPRGTMVRAGSARSSSVTKWRVRGC